MLPLSAMTDQKLIDFIKVQRRAKKTDEAITTLLEDQGWASADVAAAFEAVDSVRSAETAPPMLPVPHLTTLGFSALARRAAEIYRRRFVPLITIAVALVLLGIASALLTNILLQWLTHVHTMQTVILAGVVVVLTTGLIWLANAVLNATLLRVVAQENTEESGWKAVKWVTRHILSFLWIGVLLAIMVFAGIGILSVPVGLFLITTGASPLVIWVVAGIFSIPGLLFLVWFSFAPFVFIVDGHRGWQALLWSRGYVRGHAVAVIARIIPVIALYYLLAWVPINGYVKEAIFLLFNPFAIAYTYVVFAALHQKQAFAATLVNRTKSWPYVVVAIIGLMVLMLTPIIAGVSQPTTAPQAATAGTQPSPLQMAQLQLEYYAATHQGTYPALGDTYAPDPSKFSYTPSPDQHAYTLCPRGGASSTACVSGPPAATATTTASSSASSAGLEELLRSLASSSASGTLPVATTTP